MGCTECGGDGASAVRVSYTDGETEVLELCPDCRAAFDEGDFVREVAPEDE